MHLIWFKLRKRFLYFPNYQTPTGVKRNYICCSIFAQLSLLSRLSWNINKNWKNWKSQKFVAFRMDFKPNFIPNATSQVVDSVCDIRAQESELLVMANKSCLWWQEDSSQCTKPLESYSIHFRSYRDHRKEKEKQDEGSVEIPNAGSSALLPAVPATPSTHVTHDRCQKLWTGSLCRTEVDWSPIWWEDRSGQKLCQLQPSQLQISWRFAAELG